MKFMVVTALSFLASTCVARKCGNTEVPDALLQETARMKSMSTLKTLNTASSYSTRTQKVKLYIHNVYIDRTAEGGYISNEDMQKQFQVLNEHYASTGIYFDLRRTIHTQNGTWAISDKDSEMELEMKKSLRKGDYGDMNLYLRPLQGWLGWCTFPGDFEVGSDGYWKDGCDVLQSSIPGGTAVPYNEGKTAVHEIGHWLGLLHTFQGGCDGGDMIDDTPAEGTPTDGCPEGKDTCTGVAYPGLDPIHNFMDYSDDACLTQFTPGQTVRIYQTWDRYRAPAKA
ncbi:hypothetical protein H072_10578 [Dactylellina haptotyla CBS 200.50]|uniref:Peptidase M43 pregnancy-associated plasma-A domain-containing protein n=1 Tax=Dactylellina haptotyla (strain CBS 200.50) TaxID=1284197 RepID=S8BL37_DACHA|nr:hypothetical protein H072_10578 [Dactylellina haptotyla CBS 200.50]